MIREYTKDDTIAVANLAKKTFAHSEMEGYHDQPGLPALLDTFDVRIHSEVELQETLGGAECFLVYEKQGEIVGFIRGSAEWLKTLAVDPAHQGEGIGAKLVQAVERWAAENGSVKVDVHAAVHASDFYESMGYVKQGEISEFQGLDIYNMRKDLLRRRQE